MSLLDELAAEPLPSVSAAELAADYDLNIYGDEPDDPLDHVQPKFPSHTEVRMALQKILHQRGVPCANIDELTMKVLAQIEIFIRVRHDMIIDVCTISEALGIVCREIGK